MRANNVALPSNRETPFETHAFGQTGAPKSTRLDALTGTGLAMPGTMAPFTKGLPLATKWSGKLMQMTYSARHENKDSAWAFGFELADSMEEDGWEFLNLYGDDTSLHLSGYMSDIVLAKTVDLTPDNVSETAECAEPETIVKMREFLKTANADYKADTITLAQTKAFQATLTAKAGKLGVSLDWLLI